MNRKLSLKIFTWPQIFGIVLVIVALLFVLFGKMDWEGLLIPIAMLLAIFGNSPTSKKFDNFIDTDANPFVPVGLEVVSHQKNGIIEYYKAMVSPVSTLTKDISAKGVIFDGFENDRLINANVLDWFIGHPNFIPDVLVDKKLLFLGTIYTDKNGIFYARFLEYRGYTWYQNLCRLGKGDNNYNDYHVAIL